MSMFFSDSSVIKRMSSLENFILQLQPENSKLFRMFQSQKFAMLTSQIKQRLTEGEEH